MSNYNYHLYGLDIRSPVECPELEPYIPKSQTKQPPTITITEQNIPSRVVNSVKSPALFSASEGSIVLKIRDIGLFWITNGSHIQFERTPNVADEDVKVFLLGSCMGALLQQRGNLVLHASSRVTQKGAALFTGYSGAGKSSLLTAFLSLGYSMLADDISIVSMVQDQAWVKPGYPQAKLNADTLDKIGINRKELRWINSYKSKYAYPTSKQFHYKQAKLRMLCVLNPHDGDNFEIEEIFGTAKFELFAQNIYRQAFLQGMGLMTEMFGLITKIAERNRVFRISRPKNNFKLLEFAREIEDNLF